MSTTLANVVRHTLFETFRWPRASAEDERAFEAYLAARVAIYGCTAAVFLNVMHLIWWPTDAILLAPDPAVHAAILWFRVTTFVTHAALMVLFSLSALRRWSTHLFMLGALISSALVGHAQARMGTLDQPFLHMTYIVPMTTVAIPLRLRQRGLTNVIIGAALTLSYLITRPSELASPYLGSVAGVMTFAVAASTCYGHLLFILTRTAFLNERALSRSAEVLKGYSERLEDRVAEHVEQLRRLAAHVEQVSEAERARLARELHDELGQQVTAMRYVLSFVRARVHEDPASAHAKLTDLEEILAELAAGMRHLVSELRPRVLDEGGLGAAVEWLVERTRQRSGLPCELSASIDAAAPIDQGLATTVFRIVQESLTNAVRHANAGRLRVELDVVREGVRARVEDDGCGMGPVHVSRAGMGVLGMRERARAHGGSLSIESRPGAGTAVIVHLPLCPKEKKP